MGATPLVIGVDLGTTNLKAAALNAETGAVLARAAKRLHTRTAADGAREQDADEIREDLRRVVIALREQLGENAFADVRGIGLASQGGSGAVVERADGTALTPMYLWNDSRPAACLERVAARRSPEYWRELSQRENPGMGLARMLWLQEADSGIFSGDRLYVGAGELAFHTLTGAWRQDACNALQIGCYRVLEDRIDVEPLALVGLSEARVAPLRPGHRTEPLRDDFAAAAGLPAGLPVAGPYMDHEAGYLAAAHLSARPLQVSLGTAWVGNFLVPSPAAGWCPFQLVIASPLEDGRSLVIQPLLTGNVSWDWALTELLDADLETALGQAEGLFRARLLPPPGVICVPWLTQANPLMPGAPGGGVFRGIGPHVERGDLVRALAAGMCFEFRRVFAEVTGAGGVDALLLSGGASRGSGFRRLLATLFHPVPVYAAVDEDIAGARGALHAFDTPAARLSGERVEPEAPPTATAIREAYALYERVFAGEYGKHPLAAPYRFRNTEHASQV